MSKLCRKCFQEKPESEFYPRGIKFSSWCRPCTRSYAVAWQKKFPKKRYAHNRVAWALKHKKLVRPENCERCGKKGTVVAHHANYSKPLDVEWLCDSCHIKHHLPFKKGKKKN